MVGFGIVCHSWDDMSYWNAGTTWSCQSVTWTLQQNKLACDGRVDGPISMSCFFFFFVSPVLNIRAKINLNSSTVWCLHWNWWTWNELGLFARYSWANRLVWSTMNWSKPAVNNRFKKNIFVKICQCWPCTPVRWKGDYSLYLTLLATLFKRPTCLWYVCYPQITVHHWLWCLFIVLVSLFLLNKNIVKERGDYSWSWAGRQQ